MLHPRIRDDRLIRAVSRHHSGGPAPGDHACVTSTHPECISTTPCQATPLATWAFRVFCHTTAFGFAAADRADGGNVPMSPTSNYAGCPASCINVLPCLTEVCIINALSCAHSPRKARVVCPAVRCCSSTMQKRRDEGIASSHSANALLSPPLLEYAVIRSGLPSVEAPDLCRWG